MNKKLIPAILDGLISSVVLQVLSGFVISIYTQNLSFYQCLFLSAICSMVCATIYVFYVSKELNNKGIVILSLINILCFAFSTIAIIICYFVFPNLKFFPLREENNGDAVLLMFSIGTFMVFSICIRLIIIIVCTIKNYIRKAGDVSLSCKR